VVTPEAVASRSIRCYLSFRHGISGYRPLESAQANGHDSKSNDDIRAAKEGEKPLYA